MTTGEVLDITVPPSPYLLNRSYYLFLRIAERIQQNTACKTLKTVPSITVSTQELFNTVLHYFYHYELLSLFGRARIVEL